MIKLYNFEQTLKNAQNLKQLNQLLERYLTQRGLIHYTFTYYTSHPNSASKLKYHFASKSYQLWHNHYLSEGYADVDSTLDYSHRHVLPIYWELTEQLKAARTEKERQMRLDSIAYGIEKGLSIPVHGPNEDFAVLVVSQKKGEQTLKNWEALQYELLVAAYLYYQYLQNHIAEIYAESNLYQLTDRETQILLLIAQKCSVAEIAEKTEITERTVNYHIQKINKKLGVRNKHQAVTKALKKGIILL